MFGVYIHFPYCRKRCPYCDFAVHARARIPHDCYADHLLAELAARAPLFSGRRASTLYFGGGTPGLWRPDCIAKVVAGVRAAFALDAAAEITLEANPDDLPRAQLEGLREAGVNRLSIGVESLEPKHLATLGRLHGPEEARRAVKEARAAGFSNLSLDLMFGLPAQTLAELDRDLDGLFALAPDHVSVYNLTIEARTAFAALARSGALKVPESGLCAEMYERVIARLASEGFAHYEISSWARPGKRARHNSLYWSGGEYLGLGCSAHSHRLLEGEGGERFANLRSVDHWFRAEPRAGTEPASDPTLASYERLPAEALEREAMWLGLRLIEGIDRAGHAVRHGLDPLARHAEELLRLEREGLVAITPERIRLTARGVLFADEVGARLL